MIVRIKRPPRGAKWLLRRMSNSRKKISIIGDLEEEYNEMAVERNTIIAWLWYFKQIVVLIPTYFYESFYWRIVMFKNYIKIALRNIEKHRGYSIINIAGLALGMACCILILAWVQDELSFDKFHQHSKDLFRVVTEGHYTSEVNHFSGTPAPLAPALKDEIPEILNSVRIGRAGTILTQYGNMRFYEENILFADRSLFQMFSFPFVKGDPESALLEPVSVVVTEEMANKYFGNEDPIGKQLSFDNRLDIKVTGVIENIPNHSSIRFDFIIPFELLIRLGGPTHWGGHSYQTYVLLQPGASFQEINRMLPAWTEDHTGEPVRYYLQSLTRIHLHDLNGGGAITYVYVFSAIAVFVLLVACINFMNLSTARSSTRSLEVGLRKVVGARRSDVIRQFLGESLILTFISLVFAMILVSLFMPVFNHLSGKQLSNDIFIDASGLTGLVSVALITGLLSGSYPALFLSSFQPAKVLKDSVQSGKRGAWFRKILVIVQFSLSIILIIGSTIVYNQMSYIRNRNLGFDEELMVCLPLRENMKPHYESIKNECLQNPDIVNVTAGSGMPAGPIGTEWGQIFWPGKGPETVIPMNHVAVDDNYINAFKMELVQGRDFSRKFSTDTLNFILNETAVRAIGLESPIGEQFTLLFRTGTIIGVVKDFHVQSLRNEIRPLIMRMVPSRFWNYVFVRLGSNQRDLSGTIGFLEKKWSEYAPEYPFEYEFLDDRIDQLYRTEQRIGTIVNYFTILTMVIACMGLFGLAAYTAEQRTKEIGIRKVLGAKVLGVVLLLSTEFMKLVLISNVIAWPVAYFAMNKWLQSFAYRDNMDVFSFIIPGILALVIAIVTVSFQAVRAARINPVDSLKYE